jgi:hypothetical protein
MMQDFRFAVRQLLKTPGFTGVAVLTLALAIGVNSAIFALVNGVLLKPIVPVRPAEVVNVFTARQNASHDYRQFSHNEYRALRENGGDVFVDVAGARVRRRRHRARSRDAAQLRVPDLRKLFPDDGRAGVSRPVL